MTNAANEKQVESAKAREKRLIEQQDEDFKWLLAQPQGRRFLHKLICDSCAVFTSPGNNNGSIQSHNIGRQDVGRELVGEISRIDPLRFPQMMVEHHEAQK